MALTKKDLSQIKDIVQETVHDEVSAATRNIQKQVKTTVETAVEDLAIIVNKGFNHVENRFELMDKRLENLEGEMSHANARLDTISLTSNSK